MHFITKIEGHGQLKINWEKNAAQLEVDEGERLFEGMLEGRTAEETYWITPRICGVCPVAHNIASVKTAENALGLTPSENAVLLRRLMFAGQMIQSHVLHLFFLALPDYIGIDRGTELALKKPKLFKVALLFKEVSDEIVQTVAGRNVHPITTTIGGFNKVPSLQELKNLKIKIAEAVKRAEEIVKFCAGLKYPEARIDLEFIALRDGKSYAVYDALTVVSSKNGSFEIKDYKENIKETIKMLSTAKFGSLREKEIMVGSLARIAINGEFLTPRAKKMMPKINLDFSNPFHNNLAQAIEILHFIDEADEILKNLIKTKNLNDALAKNTGHAGNEREWIKSWPAKGVGAVEAPRGGLYHEFHINKNNTIAEANIITPTVQNLTSIEKSANALLEQTQNTSQKKRKKLLEMLVRAYDPCITCAVH
jgi:coenzyme F420-reducing hydrogenase alpha subunit